MLQCQKLLEQIRVHEETDEKQAQAKGGWMWMAGCHEVIIRDESMKGVRKDFPNDIRDIACKLLRSEDVFPY